MDCRQIALATALMLIAPLLAAETPPGKVKVAAVQCASEFGQPQRNRETLARLVRSAAEKGAMIIVLPEAAVTGYLTYDLKRTWQEPERDMFRRAGKENAFDKARLVPAVLISVWHK